MSCLITTRLPIICIKLGGQVLPYILDILDHVKRSGSVFPLQLANFGPGSAWLSGNASTPTSAFPQPWWTWEFSLCVENGEPLEIKERVWVLISGSWHTDPGKLKPEVEDRMRRELEREKGELPTAADTARWFFSSWMVLSRDANWTHDELVHHHQSKDSILDQYPLPTGYHELLDRNEWAANLCMFQVPGALVLRGLAIPLQYCLLQGLVLHLHPWEVLDDELGFPWQQREEAILGSDLKGGSATNENVTCVQSFAKVFNPLKITHFNEENLHLIRVYNSLVMWKLWSPLHWM